jgi:outer membrane lipopolysaccharide assembly protein LptE/RlpB
MGESQFLDRFPLWLIFLGTVATVLLSIQAGGYLARRHRRRRGRREQGPTGSAVAATLGLLAFMLAITFDIASTRREERRQLLLEEVNAIGTTYERADLIPEPHRSDVRALLRKYVSLRVATYEHYETIPELVKESERIQGQLWQHATAVSNMNFQNPPIAALFVDSLNQMVDLQTKRVTVAAYRIPTIVWIVFLVLTVLSMTAVGYHFGQSGTKGNPLVQLALAMSFSMVVFLIADLDRANQALFRISNAPMEQLYKHLQE